VKLSVSLPVEDIQFLDAYAITCGIDSRSAVLRRAIRLLRATELADAYEQAWDEWASSDGAGAWENVVADGVGADATR
jgi:Arc/MetJ-type ribon-helix-helix transcriptional regulator